MEAERWAKVSTVGAPALAATSASPVESTTTGPSTARRPDLVSTKMPVTLFPSTMAPATSVESSSRTPASSSNRSAR